MRLVRILLAMSLGGMLQIESPALAGMPFGQPEDNRNVEEIKSAIQDLDRIQASLSKQSQSSVNCDFNEPPNQCTFAGICEKYKTNRNSLWMHKNEDGTGVPNFKVIATHQRLQACLANDQSAFQRKTAPEKVDKTLIEKRLRFLEVLEKEKAGPSVLKIEMALFKEAFSNPTAVAAPLSPYSNKVAEEIARGEKLTGIILSPKVKNAWIQSLSFKPFNWRSSEKLEENPFVYPGLLKLVGEAGSEEKVRIHQQTAQKRINRTFELFKQTQKDIVAVLEAKKNSKNAPQIENLQGRIRTIQMEADAQCTAPNAYYNPEKHKFTICVPVLGFPDEALNFVIAHELGHSIDPCLCSNPFHRVSGKQKNNTFKMDSPGVIPFEPKLPDQGNEQYFNFDSSSAEQVLTPHYSDFKVEEIQKAVPLSQNPFSSVVACLQGPGSANARVGSIEEASATLQEGIRRLIAAGAEEDSADLKRLRDIAQRIPTEWSEKKACSFLPGKSQMQEAFSDWVATQTLSKRLEREKDPKVKMKMVFESASFFSSLGCRALVPDVLANALSSPAVSKCLGLNDKNGFLNDVMLTMQLSANIDGAHPDSADRISKILLAHPEIQKALGCSSPKVVTCE